jgi:hypothetical protein
VATDPQGRETRAVDPSIATADAMTRLVLLASMIAVILGSTLTFVRAFQSVGAVVAVLGVCGTLAAGSVRGRMQKELRRDNN